MKLVTVGEMQELERRAEAAGVPTTQLMENAGLAFARSVRATSWHLSAPATTAVTDW